MKTIWVVVIGVTSFIAGAITGVVAMKDAANKVAMDVQRIEAQLALLDDGPQTNG